MRTISQIKQISNNFFVQKPKFFPPNGLPFICIPLPNFLFSEIKIRVKSVLIRSFSGPYFAALELNTERYSPYLSVVSPYAGKYGPEKLQIRTLFATSKF